MSGASGAGKTGLAQLWGSGHLREQASEEHWTMFLSCLGNFHRKTFGFLIKLLLNISNFHKGNINSKYENSFTKMHTFATH